MILVLDISFFTLLLLSYTSGYSVYPSAGSEGAPKKDCGIFETKHRVADLRTLGNSNANPEPGYADIITTQYLAVVGSISPETNEKTFVCVGTLISNEWVLTAAHCNLDNHLSNVRLGDFDLKNSDDLPLEFPLEFPISKKVIHPLYKTNEQNYDLLLLKLAEKVPSYRYDIQPLCLPFAGGAEILAGQTFEMAGWGRDLSLGDLNPQSFTSTMVTLSHQECSRFYQGFPSIQELFPGGGVDNADIICANEKTNQKIHLGLSCALLSGSPLTYVDDSGRTNMAAFVTLGIEKKCQTDNFPSIFIPMNSANLQWIDDTINNNKGFKPIKFPW